MKNTVFSFLSAAVLAVFLCSCVSLQDREMTANELVQAQVLGRVEMTFHSWQFFHIIPSKTIKSKAYNELMREARRRYEGNIDIRNITIIGGASGWQWLNVLGYVGGCLSVPMTYGVGAILIPLFGNTQKITAVGDVVLFVSGAGTPPGNTPVPDGNTGNAPVPGGNF